MYSDKIGRVLCVLCILFAFVLITLVFSRVASALFTFQIVVFGVGLVLTLVLRFPRWMWWTIRVICALWSVFVYFVFVGFLQSSMTIHSSRIPMFMQVGGPFFFALIPLFLLWMSLYAFSSFKN